MKTNLITLTLGLLFTACILYGQEATPQKLVVHQRSGEKVWFDLEEEPITTFENNTLVITTSQTKIIYLLENIQKYTYEGVPTGVNSPIVAPGNILIRQNNEMLAIDGLPENTLVEVYAADGKVLFSKRAQAVQTTMIVMTAFPAGTYIIHAGDSSYKFVKQ